MRTIDASPSKVGIDGSKLTALRMSLEQDVE